MNAPLVSILVITFNHEQYISDCLNGILMQEIDFPIEILIGNDCSSDNTVKIVKNYQKAYQFIKLFTPENNVFKTGRDMFFTHLIPKARGKYIAFCEGDDFWTHPHKLQNQVRFLETNYDYSMCFHNHTITDGNMSSSKFQTKEECDISLSEIICLGLCQTATAVGRTSCLRTDNVANYFNHPTHTYGDINYFTAWCSGGKIKMLPGNWSVYRRHFGSVTSSHTDHNHVIELHRKAIIALQDSYGIDFLMRDYNASLLIGKSSELIRQNRILKSLLLKIKALLTSPKFILRIYSAKYKLNH